MRSKCWRSTATTRKSRYVKSSSGRSCSRSSRMVTTSRSAASGPRASSSRAATCRRWPTATTTNGSGRSSRSTWNELGARLGLGGRRVPQLAQPLLGDAGDRGGEVRVLRHQAVELVCLERQKPAFGGRRHRRGAVRLLEQGDLAEMLALPEVHGGRAQVDL